MIKLLAFVSLLLLATSSFAATSSVVFATNGQSCVYTPVSTGSNCQLTTSGYRLVFDEEFNGSAVDTAKWIISNGTTFGVDGGHPAGTSTTATANNIVTNGFLRQLVTNPSAPTLCGQGTVPLCKAAFLESQSGFATGYFEFRAKFAGPCGSGSGTIGATWSNNNGSFPEFDYPEYRGQACPSGWYLDPNYHDLSQGWFGPNFINVSPDPAASFHIYGMLWTASQIIFYIDGAAVITLNNGSTYNGFVLSIDTTTPQRLQPWNIVGSGYCCPTSATVFPAIMYVDYVHVYQTSGTATTPQPGYGGPGDATGSGNNP